MIRKETTNLVQILEVMADLELAAAELYKTCGQVWLVHKGFWDDMELAEIKHAANINRMSRIVSEEPQRFELAHPLKPAAIQTSISGIKWNMQRIRDKALTEKSVLFIARDLEHSMLEARYPEILKTDDSEYKSLINEVFSDTLAHRERLEKRIKQIAPGVTH